MSFNALNPPADLSDSAGDNVVLNDLVNGDLAKDIKNAAAGQVEQPVTDKKATKKTPKKGPAKKAAKAKNPGDDASTKDEPASPSATAGPKSTKKRGPPKKKDNAAVVASEIDPAPTPTPAAKRQYKKKEKNAAEVGDKEGDGAPVKTPTKKSTPKAKSVPKAKATPKSKETVDAGDDEAAGEGQGTPLTKAGYKRKAAEAVEGTPKTKRSWIVVEIGANYEELANEDKLIVDMKKEGKTAAQINAAWEEETGRRPAAEYIARRWPKLRAVAVKLSDDDIRTMLKVVADDEKSKYKRIEKGMKKAGIDVGVEAIEHKLKWLQENGRIDADGYYIVPTPASILDSAPKTSPTAEHANDTETVQADAAAEAELQEQLQTDAADNGLDADMLDV